MSESETINFCIGGEELELRFTKTPDGGVEVTKGCSSRPCICKFQVDGTLLLYADVDSIFKTTKNGRYIKTVKEMD